MTYQFLDPALERVNPQWLKLIEQALAAMDRNYLQQLVVSDAWLPGVPYLFSALSQPLDATKYLLLGESPYPRKESANGYAFWDAAVSSLWSETGLSKAVNRATSLRHLIKMLLHARGDLTQDFSQDAIARLNKTNYIQTLSELFQGLLHHGFLLLNASLVYEFKRIPFHAKQWRPFMSTLFQNLSVSRPDIQLILFGKIAQQVSNRHLFTCFEAEHPYQLTFMQNPQVLDFFQPFNLLDNHANNY